MPRLRHTEESLRPIIESSTTWADVCRKLQLASNGGARGHLKRLADKWGISYDHFVGQSSNKGKTPVNKKTAPELLVLDKARSKPPEAALLRRSLIEIGRKYQCEACGIGPEWNGQPLVIQVDHISGNRYDNRPENLKFLCPNCHTQTQTWGWQSWRR